MPNGNARIKFDGDYVKKCEVYLTVIRAMYNHIPAKYRPLHWNDLNNAIATIQAIKQYALVNGSKIPRRSCAPITHDDGGFRYLSKGKQAVKELHNAIRSDKRASTEQLYRKALDCIVVFQNQLPVR